MSTAMFYPISFVVRYNPPSIGLIYKTKPTERKKRKYEIFLNGLITLPTSELIARQLFYEHPIMLNPDVVPFEQIQRLVEKILSNIEIFYADEEEENNNNNNNNPNYMNNEYGEKYFSAREPYIDKNFIGQDEFNNELNKSFEIEKEPGSVNGEQLENFKGNGRLNFLRNLRKNNV